MITIVTASQNIPAGEATPKLSYLITVSRAHVTPALMLLRTLRHVTPANIVAVGNLEPQDARKIFAAGAQYVDERDIDLSGRLPPVGWTTKHREIGWYRQMMIRLSIDRFMQSEQVVILDSEVFVFSNWDERRFYDSAGNPKCFYWIPRTRKPDWDYRMYRGAAYLLQHLKGCEGAPSYANSDEFRRHFSGVVLFSRRNVAHLWERLGRETDLAGNLDRLFNQEPDLAFSDHDFYGIAVDLGLFNDVVPTTPSNELTGWYDVHDDPEFAKFRASAMWSMCQRYCDYQEPSAYLDYMRRTAADLGAQLPEIPYWNPSDRPLLGPPPFEATPTSYFTMYRRQLDYSERTRFSTMSRALELLQEAKPTGATIVEIGTLRDGTMGGGHSTFKFAEYCSRFRGTLHSVDISSDAIRFSERATADYLPWITHHVSDSTEFLRGFEGTIDLLYLDGFDSTPGSERAAAEKQLSEIQAAFGRLAKRCVVLLDDAGLPHQGKARLSGPFLRRKGFAPVLLDYQWLLARGLDSSTPSCFGRARSLLGRVCRRLRAGRHRLLKESSIKTTA